MKFRELFEMPEGIQELKDGFRYIRFEIEDQITAGNKPREIGNGIKKIDTGSELFYWIEDGQEIVLAVNLIKGSDSVIVKVTAKRYEGKPPYASDLYLAILNDQPKPVKFMGDKQLTAKALRIWKRLLTMGYDIGVYDDNNRMISKLNSVEELMSFYKKSNQSFRRYQYVLGI
jgi:hypothetical protein